MIEHPETALDRERIALADKLAGEVAVVAGLNVQLDEELRLAGGPRLPWKVAPQTSRSLLRAAVRATDTERELDLLDAEIARRRRVQT